MRRISALFYFSLVMLVAAGVLFVRANRVEDTASIIQSLKEKTMVLYSSNFKRVYKDSLVSGRNDMDLMCMEGASIMREGGLNSLRFRIEEGSEDPYTLSNLYLKKNLKKDVEYILMDINRSQSNHGQKVRAGDKDCCPISIILSEKSKSYENSLLFAGRVKAVIDRKYPTLPVLIITEEDRDYNQGLGDIGMLIEIGDAANTYEEARGSLVIFFKSVNEVISTVQH